MKRVRMPNFSIAEIMHLLSLVEKYPVLENKKTDGATTKEKQDAWCKLTIEYNSTTPGCPRNVENLLSCYKNQKMKVKKHHSNEKMSIKGPTLHEDPSEIIITESILEGIETHGKNWDNVSKEIPSMSSQECESTFRKLSKAAKKQNADFMREVKRTGGGPPPQPPSDLVMEKVKILMGPSIEGLYSIYGGDAEFMKQQQDQQPVQKRVKPIDCPGPDVNLSCEDVKEEDKKKDEQSSLPKRLKLLKKPIDTSLEASSTHNKGKKTNVSETFKALAIEKQELVILRKKYAEEQLLHQQQINTIELNIAKEKLQHIKEKNALELEYLKEKHKLELEILKNK